MTDSAPTSATGAALCLTFAFAGCANPSPAPAPKTVIYSCPVRESWFRTAQNDDGSYDGVDGAPDLAATSLAALALVGDGTTLRAGPDREVLRDAVRWLIRRQRASGDFGGGDLLAEALTTYTLVEALGQSRYEAPKVLAPVLAAVKTLLARRRADGGWARTDDAERSDAVTTAWAALACAGARDFELAVEVPANDDLRRWFEAHDATAPADLAATLYLTLRLGAAQPAEGLPERVVATADLGDPEQAFWATYALFFTGGGDWRAFQPLLHAPIVRTQVGDGAHVGSWEPAGGLGRAATTSLRVLTLEAYYRYTRLVH